MLHIPPTNLFLLAAKQEPYKKAYLLTKNIGRKFWKKLRRMDQQAGKKKDKTEKVMTRQKTKRGDSKVESNDSPAIPDRGETSDIPGLSSGATAAAEGLAPFKLRTDMRSCFNIFPNALMSLSVAFWSNVLLVFFRLMATVNQLIILPLYTCYCSI